VGKLLPEVRLIKGIGDQEVEVPMIKLDVEHPRFKASIKCGILDSIPRGVDLLLGNDVYCQFLTEEEIEKEAFDSVVTRSMSAKDKAEQEKQVVKPVERNPEEVNVQDLNNLLSQDIRKTEEKKGEIESSEVDRSEMMSENGDAKDADHVSNSPLSLDGSAQEVAVRSAQWLKTENRKSDISTSTEVDYTCMDLDKNTLINLQQTDRRVSRLLTQVVQQSYPNTKKLLLHARESFMAL